MVTPASGRPGNGCGRDAGLVLFVALSAAFAIVCAAPGRAMAAEDEETPQLWQTEQAVAYTLSHRAVSRFPTESLSHLG